MAAPWCGVAGRDEEFRAVIQGREANVDVVEVHVGGWVPPRVGHFIVDVQMVFPDLRFHPAPQQEILPEHRDLLNLPFRPEDRVVPVPPDAVAGQPGRSVGNAAVQAVLLRWTWRDSDGAPRCPPP